MAMFSKAHSWRVWMFYLASLAAAVGVFAAITWYGERTFGAGATMAAHPVSTQINVLVSVLLALTVVIITSRAVGWVFGLVGQPAVIGEVVGGILLGPSFLGWIAPAASAVLMPPQAAPFLSVISQLGVILYMFLVGMHLDLRVLRTSGSVTLAISHVSIIIPFLLGVALALGLYSSLAPAGIGFTSFALFIGTSLSVTAFPVLARILSERGLHKTEMGTVALTCAAIDDVTAWCLLAFVVSVVQGTMGAAFVTIGLTAVFIALMLTVGRYLVVTVVDMIDKSERIGEGGLAIVLVTLLLSAISTEFIGVHAIFGAFLLGAVAPSNSRVSHHVNDRLEDLVRVMFLPAFFAFTGTRTQLGLLEGWNDVMLCVVIIAVATAGKFGGTALAARFMGLNWRDSAALGILMNTRGLVGLIVLNIGLDLGVISPRLFTMLVIMALATTMMTSPILTRLLKTRPWVRLEPVDRLSA